MHTQPGSHDIGFSILYRVKRIDSAAKMCHSRWRFQSNFLAFLAVLVGLGPWPTNGPLDGGQKSFRPAASGGPASPKQLFRQLLQQTRLNSCILHRLRKFTPHQPQPFGTGFEKKVPVAEPYRGTPL